MGDTKRGLYFVGEWRCDVASVSSPVNMSVVDPGFLKPVHVACVSTGAAAPMDDAHHWFVTEDEWMQASGRRRNQEAERRRRDGTAYGTTLEELSKAGRRKSVTSQFVVYCDAMLNSLKVRAAELVCTARSVVRWQRKRKMASFIGRLCDRLFDRTSLRWKKNVPPAQLDAETVTALRAQLRQRVRQRKGERTVVFFGDASFGPTMRGHNAIPKKGILRELCHRGVTVLLEYRTSKMCPCGHDELKTTTGRLRAHKSDGATCSLLSRLNNSMCDRDVLASLNMVQCAMCALGGEDRPGHLCRSSCGAKRIVLCVDQINETDR